MATELQRIASIEAKVKKISKRLGYKQIKYSADNLSGTADCCYIFGINFNTGALFYRDEDGQWAAVPGGGGGGFFLTDGEGTTANGSAVDLGGIITNDLFIDDDGSLTDINFGAISPFGAFRSYANAHLFSGQSFTVNAGAGNIILSGIDSANTATNFLWQDAFGAIHKSTILPVATNPTLQLVTDNGRTTTNNVTIGASSVPLSVLEVSKASIGGSAGNSSVSPAVSAGLTLNNPTLATTLTQQPSPPLIFNGKQWDAFSLVSRNTSWKVYNAPQGTSTTLVAGPVQSFLRFECSDSGSLITPISLNSNGEVLFANGISMQANSNIRSASTITYHGDTNTSTQHRFANFTSALTAGSTIIKVESGGSTAGSYAKAIEVTGDANSPVFNAYTLGNVSIGPSATPSKFAQLDVNSVGRGLLVPSLTSLQRDGIPKGIVSIAVTNGGSGYAIAPGVSIPGPTGGGLTARARAIINTGTGEVTSIIVDFRGSNYVTPPTISFNNAGTGGLGNPDGSGAAATATVDVLTVPTGLMVFNTDSNSHEFYNGTNWQCVRHGNLKTVTADYTMLESDDVISVDVSAIPISVILLDATLHKNKEVTIKYASAPALNLVTITSAGGSLQRSDMSFTSGAALEPVGTYHATKKFKSNGTDWELIN